MAQDGSVKRPVKTAERTFEVLEQIKEDGSGTPTSLANDLGYSKSTIHRYLVTLDQNNYLIKRGNRYYLGLRFLDLGVNARSYIPLDPIEPKVDELSEKTGEMIWFSTEDCGQNVHLYGSSDSKSILSNAYIGKRSHMHCRASGKAMLSCFSTKRVRDILQEHGMPALTDQTITDEETLLTELEETRERGFAYNQQESVEGLCAVSAPIQADDEVLGAISIIGPSNRFESEYITGELVPPLQEVTNEIELNITFS